MRAVYQLAEAREKFSADSYPTVYETLIMRTHYRDNICDVTSVIYVNPSEIIGKKFHSTNVIWQNSFFYCRNFLLSFVAARMTPVSTVPCIL